MVDVEKISGIGEFERAGWGGRELYSVPGGKAFLVLSGRTMEVRTDPALGEKLQEKYESVMQSRYFGRGGIEVVLSGQLSEEEMEDLVRLSYNMTRDGDFI